MKIKDQIRQLQLNAMMQATDDIADQIERQLQANHEEIQRLREENAELTTKPKQGGK